MYKSKAKSANNMSITNIIYIYSNRAHSFHLIVLEVMSFVINKKNCK